MNVQAAFGRHLVAVLSVFALLLAYLVTTARPAESLEEPDPDVALGQSVGFSGDDDVVVPGVSSELVGDSTWEVWVKPEDFDSRRVLMGTAYSGEGVMTLEPTGLVKFYQGPAGGNAKPYTALQSGAPLRVGEWNHVVVTRAGSTVWMFLNGSLDSRKTMSVQPSASELPLRIGDGYLSGIVGDMDEVAVYDRALSAFDVLEHYEAIAGGDDEGYGSLVADDGPLGHWRMDENGGTVAVDETGTFPGEYRGTPTFAQPGALASLPGEPEVTLGQSVGFSGDDDVVVPGVASELVGDSTWEVWVKPEDLDSRRVLMGTAYSGEGVVTLEVGGQVKFYQGPAGGNAKPYTALLSSSSLQVGEWNHVVVTRAGSTVWMFLDGRLDSRKTMSEEPSASAFPLRIGDGYLSGIDGDMDEVAVYDRALSAADVAAHYDLIAGGDHAGYGAKVSEDGPLGHWRMDENGGTVAVDETGTFAGQYRGTPAFAQPGASASLPGEPDVALGQSVGFSGDDDVVVPGVSSELVGDSTWEVWVKPEDFDSRRVVMGTAYSGEGVMTLEPTGLVKFYQGPAGGNAKPYTALQSGAPLRVGEWNHVVVTRAGSTVWMFLDGALDSRKTMSVQPSTSIFPLRIGDGYLSGIVGDMDEVAVYDRALSAADVAAHYDLIAAGDHAGYGTKVSGDGPVGHWRMDEVGGAVAVDETGTFPGQYRGTPDYGQPGAALGEPADTTAPAVPSGLVATAGDGQVELTWDANTEDDLAGYNVYRSQSTGVDAERSPVNTELVAAGTESFVDSGVTNGTEYFYVITAVDSSDNESATSDEVTATPDAEPVAGCSPISTLPCVEVVLDAPVGFSFDGTDGGLADQAGEDIGFTMVDPPSARLDLDGDPSNAEVPGYEPGNLEITDGGLTIEATRGIQYADNVQSSNTNSLINGLGVGVEAAGEVTTVSTTVVAPDFDGTANSEKGGLWFGLDEDNLVNLTVQNQTGTNVRVQVQREVGGKVVTATDEFNSSAFAEGTDVVLTMTLDDADNTVVGSYQVGTGSPVELPELTVPQEFFDGELLADEETGPASYAGVFATKRAETTNDLLLTFGDFAVTQGADADTTAPAAPAGLTATGGDGQVELTWDANGEDDLAGYNVYRSQSTGVDEQRSPVNTELVAAGTESFVDSGVTNGTEYFYVVTAVDSSDNESEVSDEVTATPEAPVQAEPCSPISTLVCADVVPELPVELSFDGTDGGLEDQAGEDVGFTMVDPPSTRLAADGDPSIPGVPGYEPGNLEIADGGLTIEATRGIQYADNVQSSNTNSLINGLGVGVEAAGEVTTVSTTVEAPDFDGTANAEKAGLWFGLDEDNLVNLTLQNQAGTNVRAQFQREIDGVANGDANEINGSSFPEGTDVVLTMVLDDADNTVIGSYQVGTAAPVTLGEFTVPQAFFDGEILADDETGPASFTGVFATKRNEATSELFVTFGDFAVSQADQGAPVVTLSGDRTLFEAQQTLIPVRATDPQGEGVEVTVTGLPDGLSYADGSISGTVAQGAAADSPYTVEVTADDGTASGSGTFEIEVVEDIALDINFQLPTAPTPSGYLADGGAAYGDRGNGLSYGWVEQGTSTPLNMSANGRDRNRAGIDQLLDTFIHMQYNDISEVYNGTANCSTNQCTEGAWEIALPDGLYEVTLAVGDQPSSGVYDSLHAINVETGVAIREFQATSSDEYEEVTAYAGVQDGRLTIDAVGGANSKISYVEIRSLGTQPFVTNTIPANRATDAALTTSVSASVAVPGTGIGVDPSRSTSLTDDAVKLFEITEAGEVEVEGNRGSTGGNDTIAFSPTAPLEAETTYRYVIDGALDEAGNTFGAFESVFTTGEADAPGGSGVFDPVEDVNFEKVLLPTASGAANGKYFASLVVHDGHLWATTIGQGMFRYEILEDGTLGPAQDLGVFGGRASVGLVFDEEDPDLAWVTHATANLGNESARLGSKVSVVDFSDVDNPVVTDVITNLPRSAKDHLSNSLAYGPSGDGGDPWMYFLQGSNQAAGDVDSGWGNRGETQLTAALLRFDPQDALATARANGPINVATEEVGGSYDPFADDAPLEIYATGIRNAYDLIWHSNGSIYVPTNGTAGGGNSPGVTVNGGTMTMTSNQQAGQNGYGNGTDVTEECATRRIDGEPYTGGSVPAISNHPTQRDFLFEVEQGGYYGHPNPTRCEWVLNNGGDPEGAGSGGSKYPASQDPDENYRGWAYDFDFNKSPNGVIEYTSNTFGGQLQGRMMVVRFSGNDDLLTMQVDSDGTVLGAQPGTDIPGFTGYADPLDVIEDTSVHEGNLYINQYNRGGEPQELYLLRVPDGQTASSISTDVDELVMSATLNTQQPTDTAQVTVTNNGSEPVEITAAVEGTHAGQFSAPSPGTLAAGEDTELTVTFDPSGSVQVKSAQLVLSTQDGDSETVDLRGLAFQGQEGGNEPPFQLVIDALGYGISAGWTNLAGGMDPAAKGDEVLEPLFQRAGDGPVTMTPVAAFAPQENLPFGWYAAAEGDVSLNEVGSIANGQLQTLNPALGSGGTSFDPGTEVFGLYYDSNTFNRVGYTEDGRNDAGGLHRARIYPLSGDRFLVAFEDASNGDYQDYVFVIDNVVPAGDVVEPPPADDALRFNFQSETAPVPDGYLRDFGQAYGPRSGANQGSDLTYGWVDDETLEPLTLVGNGRDRDSNDDQRLDTLMHMDLPPDSDGGVLLDGSWQVAVPDGTYEVTVAVGDPNRGSAPEVHTINVEGAKAVDAFGNSTAANGSDARHEVATVAVEVLDGALTVDQLGGTNTKINYVEVVPMDGPVTQTVAQVNFQPAAVTTPTGWTADTGALFTEDRGYGWVRTEGGAAKTADTRNRTSESNVLEATTILVDDAEVAAVVDGEWEYALADGEYTVEVSVGDADYSDSTHGITAEGESVIDGFVPNGLGDYGTGSATVEVSDGALTLASDGTNTKLQWVRITSTAEGDVVPPQVAVALDGEGEGGTYTGSVTVTVTATDRTLEFVDYSVDGAPELNYTAPFEVSGSGNHEVVVTAVDGAGNTTTRTVTFTIVELADGDLTLTNPEAAPFNDRLVMSRIQSTTSNPATADTALVNVGNNGSEPVVVSALDIVDPDDFELVNPPALPATIAVGGTLPVTVRFIGTGSGQNTNFESAMLIRHNGSDGPTSTVELGAIWQSQSEGGNEPNVAEIIEAYGPGTTIVGPGQQLNNQGRLEAIGDEVLSATWKRLDTSKPATVRQLAAYHTCCSNTATFGTHPVGSKGTWQNQLTHNGQWAQTLRPRINGSSTNPAYRTFTPTQSTFSWRIDPESSDWRLNNTSPDSCGTGNDGCQLGHHVRIWPVEDRDGTAIPGSYFVVMDYSGINYDFNDNVYLVTNVAPAD
ncbi:LamG-like jellyroll fold domain-containing protein [uncultured Serinicoccus sp.]|uniref:LamG-like jellyroll fold domain-containing protein n=1 Tax=uncultured Serinicoccus sp. TaxID=735514 RepID=UPI002607712B|nr:LamG-like jellyroll fold domain-containing protein [uncultured Serinicoccus sp.]